jgi:hypothetical protein
MRNIDQTASGLFDKLRNRFSPVAIRDEKRESTLDPAKARFFSFDYAANGKNFGSITISVLGKDLKVFYAQDLDQFMTPIEKKQWFKFLKELRFFAMAEGAVFDVRDIGKSGLNLRDLKYLNKDSEVYSKDEVNVNESKLYGTRRSSYQQLEDVRIIARHSKPIVDETIPGARSRNVESFYIENSQGERFKLPEGTTINGARAYARHVKNGGQLHDDFSQHIGRMIKEMADLRMFVRNMRGRTFEDIETQQMVESAIDHYGRLHSDLHLIRSQRGYDQYRELWQPEVLEETEFDLTELRERFVRKVFDDRITNALPVVFREYHRRKMATEQEFESWANDIVREFEENPTDKDNKKQAMDAEDIEEDSADINVKSPFANSLQNVERDSAENIVDDNENQNLAGLLNEKGFEFKFEDGVYYFESKDEIERAKDWISLKFPKMKFPKMGVYDYGYGVYGSTTFDRELPGGKGVMEQKKRQQELTENLRKWFKEKWVRFGPDGKIRGDCARGDSSEGKPKCLPQAKAHALGKKGRASAARRKRREDPNAERTGAAINVKTKKESINEVSKELLKKYIKANVQDQLLRSTSDSFKSGRAGDQYNKAPFDTPVDRKRERGLDRALNRLSGRMNEGQHDQAAEEYRAHLIKTLPGLMQLFKRVLDPKKGWQPSEEQMMAAIETAYTVMKHTGDIKKAGQALVDELNTLHRISQGQQGLAENYYSDLMKQTYAKFFKPAPPKTVSAVKKFLSGVMISLGTAQDTDYDEEEPEEINWKQDLSDVREAYDKLRSNNSPNWFDLADTVFSYDTEFRESMLEWAEEELGSKLVDILWHEVWQAKQQISRAGGSHNVGSGQKVPPHKPYDPEKYKPDSPRNIEWQVMINGEPMIKFGGVSNKEAAMKTGLSWARNHGYEREVQAGKVEVAQVQQGVAEDSLNEFATGDGQGGNGPLDYGNAIIEIGQDYVEMYNDEGDGADAAKIIKVGQTFISSGMAAGIKAFYAMDTFVRDHVAEQLMDQGFNVKQDIYQAFNKTQTVQTKKISNETKIILSLLKEFIKTREEPEDRETIAEIYKAFQQDMAKGFTALYNAYEFDIDADFTEFASERGVDLNDIAEKHGLTEGRISCPECGGPAYSSSALAEKKDACYYKVKARYKVIPSAYASGAMERCRNMGAKNWGNKSKK